MTSSEPKTPKAWANSILNNAYSGYETLQNQLDMRDFPVREVIKLIANIRCPNGFPMTIRSQSEWEFIAEAVNQGIDSHLEAFTKSRFDNGDVLVHPDEMGILIDRMNQLCIKQDNEEFAAWEAEHPGEAYERSSELEERDMFVQDLCYVLCKKDED